MNGHACVTTIGSSYSGQAGIHVNFSSASQWASAISSAMSLWNESCGNLTENRYPWFLESTSGGGDLRVVYSDELSGNLCGDGQRCAGSWNPATLTLTVHELFGDPNNPSRFSDLSPTAQALLFAHEFGHALGLSEGTCGGVMDRPASSLTVSFDECYVADAANNVPITVPDKDVQPGTVECPSSPIIFDLSRDGYALTSATGGVWFDIDSDGVEELIGWTARNADEAFLWRDANGNGVVDGGRELFGTVGYPNGFENLRRFDRRNENGVLFGGNADGRIDASDAIWRHLLLWQDLNHDGVSQSGEITAVADSAIRSIDLDYKYSGRRDADGNLFSFRSSCIMATPSGNDSMMQVYDVFFAVR